MCQREKKKRSFTLVSLAAESSLSALQFFPLLFFLPFLLSPDQKEKDDPDDPDSPVCLLVLEN